MRKGMLEAMLIGLCKGRLGWAGALWVLCVTWSTVIAHLHTQFALWGINVLILTSMAA